MTYYYSVQEACAILDKARIAVMVEQATSTLGYYSDERIAQRKAERLLCRAQHQLLRPESGQ